jgi:CheY-like chemotaxis protein
MIAPKRMRNMAKVLIIEDDLLLSRMYQTIFTTNHYDTEVAADGEEGMEKARSFHPTVILLDIMMPKLNGIEVLKRLKNEPELKNIPVVVLTNLAGNNDVQTALNLGAVRYIIKSENRPKEVEEIVRGILAASTRDDLPPVANK